LGSLVTQVVVVTGLIPVPVKYVVAELLQFLVNNSASNGRDREGPQCGLHTERESTGVLSKVPAQMSKENTTFD
jgi:hypothetical protein